MQVFVAIINFIRSMFGISKPTVNPIPAPTPQLPSVEFYPITPVNVIKNSSPNFESYSSRKIEYIIVHSTGGTAASALTWFKNKNANVSAHYLIGKNGTLYEIVDDKNVAWHAGKSSWNGIDGLNKYSIGIELENLNNGVDNYTSTQISVLLYLVSQKMKAYNIPASNVLRHLDIAPGRKIDPVNFPWESFIISLKRAIAVL